MSTRPAPTARVLVTGSADGLGRAAAQMLLEQGHEVVVHARNRDRLAAVRELLDRGAAAVVGDLSDPEETRDVAGQVNRLGRMDAVIHNAGVVGGPQVLPVNVVAPYLLTALIDRPQRLVYLTSGMHRGGRASLTGIDWSGHRATGSYSDSKLLVTTLAVAVARICTDVVSNAVDPGWVPTKMGGPGAPDDLRLGHRTQVWLATSEDPQARTSGGYWYHQRRAEPAPSVHDQRFQDQLLEELAGFTATRLVCPARSWPEQEKAPMNPIYDFTSQVALVTGASSGMGLATAQAFAQAGATVVLADINDQTLGAATDELTASGYRALAVTCDVADEEQVAALVERTVDTFGRLDFAFNNAGIQAPPTDAADEPAETFDRVHAINLRGVWACMKHELRPMRAQGSGAIVNCSSLGGLVGLPGRAAYHASKHGVLGLTKSAALEYAPRGVRINAICPGTIETPMVADMLAKGELDMDGAIANQPIARLGQASEIAAAVLWLCSPGASFVIGVALPTVKHDQGAS